MVEFITPSQRNNSVSVTLNVLLVLVAIGTLASSLFSQNIGINTDGSAAESGVLLDLKAPTPINTTTTQTVFQIKSNNTSANELKIRLVLGTHATAGSRQL